MLAAAPATPVKPNNAAISAITRKIAAHLNIGLPLLSGLRLSSHPKPNLLTGNIAGVYCPKGLTEGNEEGASGSIEKWSRSDFVMVAVAFLKPR
jgi:hypothetical protein